jgi:hypothetical protein
VEIVSPSSRRGNHLILKRDEILSKIDAHEQKYEYSCIPSVVEMVLKLLDKVCRNYYELQKKWDNRKDRSFDVFIDCFTKNGECEGLIFKKRDGTADELFRVIDEELEAGRYVIISLKNPVGGGDHMWVIYSRTNGDYLSFSKASCSSQMVTFPCNLRNYIRKVGRTDILTYTEVF